ncbi:MAG: ATP-binding protein [Bacteroidetes bacterium]|nr:ATP-binding protein [Bacteroidota bacterium]MBU1719031.1 ATP-binding protein [Bacteroidota bacterium]
MEKELMRQVFIEQRSDFLNRKTGVIRERLSEASAYIKLPHIYVISGIRRCGKSTLMRQIAHQYFPSNDFFFLNFEDERLFNYDVAKFNQILELQIELFGNHKTFFIDEIQNVEHFELFLRRLSDSGYKFIVSGSNASILSGELGTRITGRHIETTLQPFNFREFLRFKGYEERLHDIYLAEKKAKITGYFEAYFQDGGMPEYLNYDVGEILTRMYDDILIKDIAVRNNITHIVPLKELSQYVISNFGRRFSYNSLQKALSFGSVNTAKSYCSFLDESFLTMTINKFDYSLKKQQQNEKKMYVCDHSIIHKVSNQLTGDSGRILENIVANELAASGLLYYFSGTRECDFVSFNDKKEPLLIQVCADLNQNNYSRETEGLIEALNFFQKEEGLILTMSQEEEIKIQNKTLHVLPLWKWLMLLGK